MFFAYTDGSVVRPHDGSSPGGWAFSYYVDDFLIERAGGFINATNNQMEIVAVIKAFQSVLELDLNDHTVCVVSDSQYVVHGATRWLNAWKNMGWINGRGKAVKNKELWMQIDYLQSRLSCRFKWVRGHCGNPQNERVDVLARSAARRSDAVNLITRVRNTLDLS